MRTLSSPQPVIFVLVASSLGTGAQAPVAAPGFTATIDGRPFEPTSAFALISRDSAGDSIRIVIDEVASSCEDLDEVRGRRIALGPFAHRPTRAISAANANASVVRLSPDGRVEVARFARGSIRIREVDRDPPSAPFELTLDLEGGSSSDDRAEGDLHVTPCLLGIR